MSEILESVMEWALRQLGGTSRARSGVAGSAEGAGGAGGAEAVGVVGVVGLREGSNPWMLRLDDGRAAVLRVGDAADEEQRDGFRTEARTLDIAERHGIPTSRLIAVDATGTEAGALALLSTVIEGSSRIPMAATPELMRAYGAGTATLHRVPASALDGMARRVRPIQPVDFAEARRRQGASDLLVAAEAAVAEREVPERAPGLLHGDLWLGNTMWVGTTLSGFVDWDCAGIGEAGLDVASIRLDVELMFGAGHAEAVTAGYLAAAGRDEVPDLAYWDVVAALSTPPRMREFVGTIQDQGRADLDQPTLEGRRDEFLRAALERLG